MIDILTNDITLIRHAAGAWQNDGTYQKAESQQTVIQASVQPLNGNQVKLLPEHRRTAESIVIYTETELQTTDEKNNISADVILYQGKRFQVFNVKNWSEMDIAHFECIAIKEDGQGGGV